MKAPKKPAPRVPERHPCADVFCQEEGCFGIGPPIQPQQWFCRAHLPDDYWTRGQR